MRLSLLPWLCLSFLLACEPAFEAQRPPNVILILADDLGYNDLSRYRPLADSQADTLPQAQTPQLDQLGGEGMTFTQFYAGAAVCSPSRAALLTGRNCTRAGIYNWIPPNQPMHLRSEEVTLAEMLKPLGYQTGHFGKWHLTAEGMGQPLPNDQGFDYSFFAYNNANPSHKDPENYFRNGEPVGQLEGYACQLVMDEALAWLERRVPTEPFYLNVWFNEPHVKLAAPDSLTARHDFKPQYYGAIENLDLAVGRLLRYLEEQGLAGETLVVFTSDNGSQELYSNDPLRGEKCLNFEGGLRVPLMVRWPGRIPAGVISDQPGGFPDVLPTLASLTGAALPADRKLDGTDLSPVWRGEQEALTQRSPIFFYRYFHDPILMLREGDWVLLGYEQPPYPYAEHYDIKELALLKPDPAKPDWSMWGFQAAHMAYLEQQQPQHFELYDLASDPQQRQDLSANEPARVARMKIKMRQLREEMVQEGGNWFGE
jgi:arylsulfatase A